MNPFRFACAATALALLTMFSREAAAANDIVLLYNGPAVANTQVPPSLPAFVDWCNYACNPTVQLPMFDASTGKQKGSVYVWGTPFSSGSGGTSLCFSEFLVFALDDGIIYTHSPKPNGTCGGFIDPALKPASHVTTGLVVGGGGNDVIVGGTGKYARWRGTYVGSRVC